MSAYIKHEVCYKRKHIALLVEALEELYGKGNVEVHERPQFLRGYMGDLRPQKAHVIVRKEYVGESANDVGFEFAEDGSCTAHVSKYDRENTFDRFNRNKVASSYAEKVIMGAAKKNKFKSVERKKEKGKTILRLRRKNWG